MRSRPPRGPSRRRGLPRLAAVAAAAVAGAGISACTSVSTARVSPDDVHTRDERAEPVAAIQADAISAYVAFVSIPGVDLDTAVNRLLIARAKLMGADKVTGMDFSVTPDGGVWNLRKLLGWRSARASGIAVRLEGAPPDPDADEGPEPEGPGGGGTGSSGSAPPPPENP